MRLISCYIENFGKFSETGFEFTSPISSFCEENSWGKTTLAEFICVMLYGFNRANSNNSSDKNDRKRFTPWQGGVYGGRLVFELSGEEYMVTRTFDKTEKGDTLSVTNMRTGLECKDFTAVGEELFGIDKESFRRTVFIAQSDCESISTDAINAKLGNLIDDTSDINNYETVIKKLSDMLSPRKEGSFNKRIKELQEREKELTASIKTEPDVRFNIDETQAALEQKKNAASSLEAKKQDLNKKFVEAVTQSERALKKEAYSKITEKLKSAQSEEKERRTALGEKIPSADVISAMKESAKQVNDKKIELGAKTLSQEEEQRLSELEKVFKNGVPSDEDILIIKEKLSALNNAPVRKMPRARIAAAAMFAAGAALLAFATALGIALIAFSVLVFLFAKPKNTCADSKENINAFVSRYYPQSDENAYMLVTRLETDKQGFVSLTKKKENADKLHCELSELEKSLKSYFDEYHINDVHGIEELEKNLLCYEHAAKQTKDLIKEKEEFEEQNNVDELNADVTENNISADEIKAQLTNIEEDITDLKKRSEITLKSLETLLERAEEIVSEKEELAQLQEEKSQLMQKKKTAELAKQFLTQAEENLTAKYIGPVKNGFLKYFEKITGTSGEDEYSVDAGRNIHIQKYGKQRDVKSMSAGYRDLIGICMRVALIDEMYKEEKPFIIADDPFINLDSDKLSHGKKLIGEIAEKYQVIYFTCHESRNIERGCSKMRTPHKAEE